MATPVSMIIWRHPCVISASSPNTNATTQTAAFEQMKKELAPIAAKAEKEEVGKPSLLITKEEGCEPPKKLEYKPGQPIEQICATPAVIISSAKEAK
jgi:hypothetical protein